MRHTIALSPFRVTLCALLIRFACLDIRLPLTAAAADGRWLKMLPYAHETDVQTDILILNLKLSGVPSVQKT